MSSFSPENAESLLALMDEAIKSPLAWKGELFAGVDLGTAYVVVTVVDSNGNPVAGAYRFAEVVRDGVVVDFTGAVRIVRSLKSELEKKLGVELRKAAAAFPPGTGKAVEKVHFYVAEGAGFEVIRMIDEPTAANYVLGVKDGVIVDVGGGTTGIAVVNNGEVIYTADEPTGGTHFSLVIAGALKISFEEAEEYKKDPKNAKDVLMIVKPVVQKVASIIHRHLNGFEVECVYLVGGTACLQGIEDIISQELGLAVWKPRNPLFVTPLGIALSCLRR
ncbi:MAG: ethanolamine utilization protein EutJ [Synergistetes bacterium]|nr:ethanolamine utilization protein EutJ [Synergistota bacterium]MCX8127755.1 ethanolamine utilization protein EutJ [Synergistota bacterium]MDW8191329.1 ethanolamine utilization protein EutJ [Synergistota bacterium]